MVNKEGGGAVDLAVVIVCYNSGKVVVDNLRSVVGSENFKTVIVDNNSTDDSVDILLRNFSRENVIILPNNIGYGRAANKAFECIDSSYALLLNPDIMVSESDILDFFKDSKGLFSEAAIVAPATNEKDHKSQGPISRSKVLGAAMLFDMKKMKSIGFFDENLFLFYEELDLCRRVIDSNESIVLLSDHYFPHAKGTSSGPSDKIHYVKNWHVGWSGCYYFNKHGLASGRRNSVILLMRYLLKSLFSAGYKKRLKYRARVAGVAAYLCGKNAFDDLDRPRGFPKS